MAGPRKSKLLICFYCGKRSSIPNDGSREKFLCSSCDATNYLDENGEITDPPVATESEVPAPRYVQSKPGSPTGSRNSNIFCETCLKNQRLFTASLAQYLPDDPSDPINDTLDRKYYKFRRDLEERYPQVCADCEARVQGRLQAAGYTAQTDHLRRLMANSRARRPRKKLTALDLLDRAGSFFWWTALVMQLLWHFKVAAMASELAPQEEDGLVNPDASRQSYLIQLLLDAASWLPHPYGLIGCSITFAFCSIWWNPCFIQVARGFDSHLVGFRQWYCFQGLIIFFRFIFRRVGELEKGNSGPPLSLITPHILMAGLMILISLVARRSIREDTRALFNVSRSQSSPTRARPPADGMTSFQQGLPSSQLGNSQRGPGPTQRSSQGRVDLQSPPGPDPAPMSFSSAPASQDVPLFQQQPSPLDEPEEMDWTPTQSQHRAFSNLPAAGSASRPFSETPIQAESGPFWYKVPPAPMTPAQKLRNPPRVPIMGTPITDTQTQGLKFAPSSSYHQTGPQARSTAVEFTPPTFFAPTKDDERSSLAEMLDKSFSLTGEPDGSEPAAVAGLEPSARRAAVVSDRLGSIVLFSYALLLLVWTLSTMNWGSQAMSYITETKVCVMFIAGILSLSRVGDSGRLARRDSGEFLMWLWPLLEVVELALLCYIGCETWAGEAEAGPLGLCVLVFGFMKNGALTIAHRRHPTQN